MFSSGSRDASRFIRVEEEGGSADGRPIPSDVLSVSTPGCMTVSEPRQIRQCITGLFELSLRSMFA